MKIPDLYLFPICIKYWQHKSFHNVKIHKSHFFWDTLYMDYHHGVWWIWICINRLTIKATFSHRNSMSKLIYLESNVIKNTYNLHITLRAYSLLFSCCPGQHSCDLCVSHILASAVAWGTDCSVGSKCDNSITICRYSIVKCSTLPSILWRKKSQRWEK